MQKTLKLTLITSLTLLTLQLSACNDSGFTSSSGSSRSPATSATNTSKATDDDPTTEEHPQERLETGVDSLENGRIQQAFQAASSTHAQIVDVVFAVDTSASMGEEKANLEKNMSGFLTILEQEAPSADFQIFMIGEDFRFPDDAQKITKVEERVDSHNALMLLRDFFNDDLVLTKKPRAEAMKQMVVISDDNARDVTAPLFLDFMDKSPMFAAGAAFNGFVGLDSSVQNAQCSLMEVGKEYLTIAADQKFGGMIQDLCSQDWNKLLKNLAKKIASEVRSRFFKLDFPANPAQPIIITVDGIQVDSATAQYDAALQAVIFAPGKEPTAGAKILVSYKMAS